MVLEWLDINSLLWPTLIWKILFEDEEKTDREINKEIYVNGKERCEPLHFKRYYGDYKTKWDNV
jgi:hypothetical protein